MNIKRSVFDIAHDTQDTYDTWSWSDIGNLIKDVIGACIMGGMFAIMFILMFCM